MSILRPLSFLSLFLFLASPGFAAIGEWSSADHVRLRLVATRAAADGSLDGVIEIELDPGWKTYWRSPGDAGIPPRFDFSRSTNVAAPQIDFPPPERSDDGFNVSNVYHGSVLLPVRFARSSSGEAARLDLTADLGVCDEICLPISLTASLDVPVGDVDPVATGLVAEARAGLPGPGRPGKFEILSIARDGGDDRNPVFAARVAVGGAADAMLFAETPPDWYPAPPVLDAVASTPGQAVYRFAVDRKSATTPIEGAEIRLTLKEADAATSRAFKLDAEKPSP